MAARQSAPLILLALAPFSQVHEALARGIAAASRRTPSKLDLLPVPYEGLRERILRLRPDGVIGAIREPNILPRAGRNRPPLVHVSGTCPHLPRSGLYHVLSDERAVGRMAAEHFLERGLNHFGFCGIPGTAFSDERWAGFANRLEEVGRAARNLTENMPRFWNEPHAQQTRRLDRWLLDLPKPVGIFSVGDWLSLRLAQDCRHLELAVPGEVALLGVGNESHYTELVTPQLSSIDAAYEERGAFALELLQRVLRGQKPEQMTWLIPPKSVTVRGSTSTFFVKDKAVRRALQFMHDAIDTPYGVSDVVSAAGVSRRTLDQRFKQIVGHTISNEVWRLRFARAQRLLRDGELSILNVALSCGFTGASSFSTMFHNRYGMSPSEFRAGP